MVPLAPRFRRGDALASRSLHGDGDKAEAVVHGMFLTNCGSICYKPRDRANILDVVHDLARRPAQSMARARLFSPRPEDRVDPP